MFDSTLRKNGHCSCISRSSASALGVAARATSSTAVPKPYQPGSISRHWPQLNTHGIARRSSMRVRRRARRRPAADVELGDLGDRRRARGSTRRTRASRTRARDTRVSAMADSSSSARVELGGARSPMPLGVDEARLHRRGDERFEVAPAELRIGVLARDDLALLGDAQPAGHAARRLREDRLVRRAAAAPDGAAAAVEQPQLHAVRARTPRPAASRRGTAPSWR